MNRSFEEYFVPLVFDAASFERRFRGENLDAEASKLWFRGDELIGLVLIARRGWTSRVAAMGLVIGERGKGYGKVMLQAAVVEATARGDNNLLLEVFTPNERARRLYEATGFRNTRLLTTFNCPADRAGNVPAALAELDPREVARMLIKEVDTELPWMVSSETLAAVAPPVRAFHLEGKAFAIVRADPHRTILLTLVVPKEFRRQGWGSRLLQLLEATYAHRGFMAHSVLEGPGYHFLEARGWQPQALTLYEMVLPLMASQPEL
ncbi:GNAT family N-acetyltransferase [Hymenobacter arizonensis]|nr:GNAT family N-acetyltransferase [Hymenobacter arizonensis]